MRIGHIGMSPLKPQKKYVDFSNEDFVTQMGIVAAAKFFVEISPSGPTALARSFHIPWLRCNGEHENTPQGPGDILILKKGNELTPVDDIIMYVKRLNKCLQFLKF